MSLDHVGVILGIDLSRLARSNKDWHQLIELCAIFGTMLADQDGLYNPTDYNDRLLLGLRGIMNEVLGFSEHLTGPEAQIRLKSSGQTFSGTGSDVPRNGCVTQGGYLAQS